MNHPTTSRASLRALVLALVGTMVALVAPAAHAAPDRAVGSFETYKAAKFSGSAPWGIAPGPDGAMWFTEQGTSWISQVGTGKGRLVTTSVNGRPAVGSRLTCASANASPWIADSTAYTWLRNGSPIPGATKRTHRLTAEDARSLITCQASLTLSPSMLQLGAKATPIRVVHAA